MLTDIFISLIGNLLNGIVNLIPSFSILDNILQPIKEFFLIAHDYSDEQQRHQNQYRNY